MVKTPYPTYLNVFHAHNILISKVFARGQNIWILFTANTFHTVITLYGQDLARSKILQKIVRKYLRNM